MSAPLLLALGSPHGDDQVAWRIADQVAGDGRFHGTCVKLSSPWDVPLHLAGSGIVIVIDACQSGEPPGRIHEWPARDLPPDRMLNRASTHGGSLFEALRLAESLGADLSRVTVLGVEIAACGTVTPLSESARRAADAVTVRIVECLGAPRVAEAGANAKPR